MSEEQEITSLLERAKLDSAETLFWKSVLPYLTQAERDMLHKNLQRHVQLIEAKRGSTL